jgi:hypothetical protein
MLAGGTKAVSGYLTFEAASQAPKKYGGAPADIAILLRIGKTT